MRPDAQQRIEAELAARVDELEQENARLRAEVRLRDRWAEFRDARLAQATQERDDARHAAASLSRLLGREGS